VGLLPVWIVARYLRDLDFPGPDGACRCWKRKSQSCRVSADSSNVNI